MPTQITNQANIAFNYGSVAGSATSNVATTTLLDAISAEKHAIGCTYRAGERITYTISVTNNGNTTLQNVTVVDNLGTTCTENGEKRTPLTFTGDASLYIGCVFSCAIEGEVCENSVTFVIPTLAPCTTAMIVYTADVNECAPIDCGSEITNEAAISVSCSATPIRVCNTITVEEYADIRMTKEMCPDPVSGGETLTYTFTITNYGNTPATNVVLTDCFAPAPCSISVTVNGQAVPSSKYTYEDGLLTLPASCECGCECDFEITVPAAELTHECGCSVKPGVVVITVRGTL